MSNTSKYVAKSFLWGSIAKILDAAIKFVSVPLLLTYFGRENFGLIALATSVNAYLQLLDMGINTGSIKYFSEWIGANKFDLLDKVARTSITFYGAIGIVNALALILMSFFGADLFSLTASQAIVIHNLFLILAIVAIVNWSTSVFNQLLTANENIAYVQKINIIRSILGLMVIYTTMFLKWELTAYFTWVSIVNSLVLFPYFIKAKKSGLISSFIPGFDWINFGTIFKYSLAIIAMGIFQMTATKMRPIVLGIFSDEGIGIVADYRVMETITIFIISIGGMFISIFLPKTSKLLLKNDKEKVARFAYDATLYISIICVILSLPIVINAREIISIYVGESYIHLSNWLILWVLTILFYLHNSPVASLVLSTGKTRMLIYSSAISCSVSIIINAVFCKQLGAGSAVMGYTIYIVIQMSFYYLYFNNKILKLNSWKVFKSFIIPTILGGLAALAIWVLHIDLSNIFLQIIIKCLLWFVCYILCLILFKVINVRKLIMNIGEKA